MPRNDSQKTGMEIVRYSDEVLLGTVPQAKALVEVEQAQGVRPDIATDEAVIAATWASLFGADGQMVAPSSVVLDDLHERTLTEEQANYRAQVAQDLLEFSSSFGAKATARSYASHLSAWANWCAVYDKPVLPFGFEEVALHLLAYAFERGPDGQAVLDEDGNKVTRVAFTTLNQRLAALNKASWLLGLPRPGDNPRMSLLMSSLRREMGAATPHQKKAIDLDLLERCLAAAENGLTYTALRDRAAVLLRVRTGASAGQISSLTWDDITLPSGDRPDQVTVRLTELRRRKNRTAVTVPAHANPDLCLATTLRNLKAVAPRVPNVIAHPESNRPRHTSADRSPSALTRQAVHLILRSATGGDIPWDELPQVPDRTLAKHLAARRPDQPLITARNRALLLTGWHTALRRSNLAAIKWGHLEEHGEDGISIKVYRTKTDQAGSEKTKWIAQAPEGARITCPATALRAWRLALTEALGRPPRNDEPLFPSLSPAGHLKFRERGGERWLCTLDAERINEVVQELASSAGLPHSKPTGGDRSGYGAHSLRAGFVTEALRDDKLTIAEVQEVTDHKTPAILMTYRREVNAAKRNASRKLLGIMAK